MTSTWNSGADLLIKAIFIDAVLPSFSSLSARYVLNCLDKEVMKGKVVRQKAQQKLTSRSVYPFPLLLRRLSTVFFIDSETNETILLHFRDVFHFFSQKNSLSKTFLVEYVRSCAASCNKRLEFWRETHTPLWLRFWLDVSFFSHVKKHRSWFWLDVSFFSRVKTIARSSDWLELICVWKFTT